MGVDRIGKDRSWDEARFKLEIATVTDALAKAQLALAEATNEINKKNQKIDNLLSNFQTAKETVEVRGFLYTKNEEGEPQGFPFCPVCYQEGRMIKLTDLRKPGIPLTCPKCKADFAATYFRYRND